MRCVVLSGRLFAAILFCVCYCNKSVVVHCAVSVFDFTLHC